jgi:ATP-dependent Clp protease ATP-binding subunit ClpB
VDPTSLVSELSKQLNRMSKVNPPPDDVRPSSALVDILRAAKKIADSKGDTHVAVDHLLVALLEDRNVAQVLQQGGLSKEALADAITAVRAGRKITNKSADANYEALSKYGTDLTERAREGKLDPVIGRDQEIRIHTTRISYI